MFIVSVAVGQETTYGPGYQTMLMSNPALPGVEGTGELRLSYLNFYPGNQYNLHSFYASYDSYFPELHGGTGIWLSDDYLGGIVNDIRGGISYAYFLQAGKDLYLNAGLSAGFFRRGFNFSNAVLPDMIDPVGGAVLPPGETLASGNRTVLDIGAGFLLIYRNFFAGLAIGHLSRPDLTEGSARGNLERKLMAHAAADLGLGESNTLKLRPMGYLEIQSDNFTAGLGASLESVYLAFNTMILHNNNGNTGLQAGFALKSGLAGIFYNYRFSLSSKNTVVPLSLLHQTGISFTLNNPGKRISLNTISLPKL